MTWEDVYAIACRHRDRLDRCCRYMETKTASLVKAFRTGERPARQDMGAAPGR